MKFVKRIVYLIILFGVCGQCVHARDLSLSYQADLSYSEANPDFSAFENGEGVAWYARATYSNSAFIFARRANASFQPSGKVSGPEVEYWFESGLGYQSPIAENWTIEGNISYQEIAQNSVEEKGKGYQLGARYEPYQTLGLALNVGKIDVIINDWTLTFEADYSLSEHTFLIARLRDYADWDFTYYEFGFGVRY